MGVVWVVEVKDHVEVRGRALVAHGKKVTEPRNGEEWTAEGERHERPREASGEKEKPFVEEGRFSLENSNMVRIP